MRWFSRLVSHGLFVYLRLTAHEQLWNEERRRMQDTVDALQAKATREQEMRSSRANLVEEELAALRGVKERISASQETMCVVCAAVPGVSCRGTEGWCSSTCHHVAALTHMFHVPCAGAVSCQLGCAELRVGWLEAGARSVGQTRRRQQNGRGGAQDQV